MANAQTIPSWIFLLNLPQTKTLQFEQAFSTSDQGTQETLRRVSALREELRKQLEAKNCESAIAACQLYLPVLYGLMAAAGTLPKEAASLAKVTWTTPISYKNAFDPFSCPSLHFEHLFVLLAYAIAHRNQAAQLLLQCQSDDSLFLEKSALLGTLLRKASGIFQHIDNQVLSQWQSKPNLQMAEIRSETYVALSALSLAEADALAMRNAKLSNKPDTIIARLSTGVGENFQHAERLLRPMLGLNETLLQTLTQYCDISSALFHGVSFKMSALDYHNKAKYGVSVAYARKALKIVRKHENTKVVYLENFLKHYLVQLAQIQKLESAFSTDNERIYYELVIDEASLEQAVSTSLMKSIPFIEPTPQQVHVHIVRPSACVIQ